MTKGAKSCAAMGRRSGFLVCVLLAATVATVTAAAARAEEGPYPIWLSPRLELESLDKLDERLARDLFPSHGVIPMSKGDREHRLWAIARSCNDVLRLDEQGYEGDGSHFKTGLSNRTRCRALRSLKDARPARQSYLRDFRLDEAAVDFLPPLVMYGPPCENVCDLHWASIHGRSMRDLARVERLELIAENLTRYVQCYWSALLTRAALADINGDGLEDMLVIADNGASEGTLYFPTYLWLTRDSESSVLRVLDPDRYLFTSCSCDDSRGLIDWNDCPGASGR